MTFTVGALGVGAVAGLLTGGRLRNVAGHRLVAGWLLVLGVILHAAAARLDLGPLGIVSLLAGYGCLLAFAARNQTLVGIGIVAIGLAANAFVIAVNDGMPVRTSAVVAAHITDRPGLAALVYGRLHHLEHPGDRLGQLGDIIPVPMAHEVLSFGDLILAVGVADLVAHLLHPKRRRRPAGRAKTSATGPPASEQVVGQADDRPRPTVQPLRPIPVSSAALD
jgi:hypothetical protein